MKDHPQRLGEEDAGETTLTPEVRGICSNLEDLLAELSTFLTLATSDKVKFSHLPEASNKSHQLARLPDHIFVKAIVDFLDSIVLLEDEVRSFLNALRIKKAVKDWGFTILRQVNLMSSRPTREDPSGSYIKFCEEVLDELRLAREGLFRSGYTCLQ